MANWLFFQKILHHPKIIFQFSKTVSISSIYLSFSCIFRAQYCNYEVLVHAFKQNIIDLSQAEIIKLNLSESSPAEFETFIKNEDKFSKYQQDLLSDKFQLLQKLERELTWKKHSQKVD